MQSVAWREHPYRLGVIGPKSDLRAMTREDLYAHYKRYYMTNNATLAVNNDTLTLGGVAGDGGGGFGITKTGGATLSLAAENSLRRASGASWAGGPAQHITSGSPTTLRRPATPTPRRWLS